MWDCAGAFDQEITLPLWQGDFFWFYNLFWGAKVTVQMRVLSAPTFFNKKIGICTQILYN